MTIKTKARQLVEKLVEGEAGDTQYIKRRGDKWVLLQKGTGKVIGTHPTRDKALGQLKAIEYHKHE